MKFSICKTFSICAVAALLVSPTMASANSDTSFYSSDNNDLSYLFELNNSTGDTVTNTADSSQALTLNDSVWSTDTVTNQNYLDLSGGDTLAPTLSANTIGGDLTFSSWARYDNTGDQWQRIFEFGSGVASNNIVFGNSGQSNNMSLVLHDPYSREATAISAKDSIVDGEWAHWTTTITQDGYAAIYKNGELLNAKQLDFGVDAVLRDENYLGGSNWDADDTLDGGLAGFAVFTAAFDSDQVAALYQESSQNFSFYNSPQVYGAPAPILGGGLGGLVILLGGVCAAMRKKIAALPMVRKICFLKIGAAC